jgi:opacity protein-like surface antigen
VRQTAVISVSIEVFMSKIQKLLLLLVMTGVSSPSWAQGAFRFGADERRGEWNVSLGAVYQIDEGVSGEQGTGLELDDDWGLSLVIGYNFNNRLALGFEMSFLDPKYDYTYLPATDDPADGPNGDPVTISNRANIFNGVFRGTWYLASGAVAPFIDVLGGWRYIDSNIASGPGGVVCWWDPWWGYICSQTWSTYTDTSFTYGAGLGLRWDVTRDMFLRAGWTWSKTDTGKSEDPTFEMGRLEVGWRY